MYEGLSARIALGARGLTGSKNQVSIDPTSLLQAESIKFDGEFISKEDGAVKYNATPLAGNPRIVSMFDWFPMPSVQYLIAVTSDGKIYRDDLTKTFPVVMKSGLAPFSVAHICEGGKEVATSVKKLFVFTGTNPVQVAGGTGPTTSDLNTPPADWAGSNQPRFGIAHNNRIWAGGNDNDVDRLYYCDIGNHEIWTGTAAGSFSIGPGIGERLVGGISFGGRLIMFKKPRGIFWVDDSPLLKSDWRVRKLSDGVGLASPWAVAALEGDVIFESPSGMLYLLSLVQITGGTDTPGGLVPTTLTDADDLDVWIRETLSGSTTSKSQIVYNSSRRRVFISGMRKLTAGKNDAMIALDTKRGNMKFSYSYRDVVESLTLQRQADGRPILLSGDDAGQVWIHEQEVKSKNAVGYLGKFQTSHTDFAWLDARLSEIRKRMKFMIIHFNPQNAYPVSVDILSDGIYTQTVVFPIGTIGTPLDSFILGTDRLGGITVTSRRRRIRGSGFLYSAIFHNQEQNQDFNVSEIVWQFTPAARRERM